METGSTKIRVRSHRQAMDWSLVLVSQGIESTIQASQDGLEWGLLVPAQDYANALRALRQYRLENRGWPWRQEVFQQGYWFDWGAMAWLALIAGFFWLGGRVDLRGPGVMDTAQVTQGQWWRLLTAIWLHADFGHLATNAGLGLVLLGLAMGRYGTAVGMLAAYLAGMGGNAASWLLGWLPHRSLGASGMVMGGLGLLAAQSLALLHDHPQGARFVRSSFLAGAMLFVLLGLTPGTDVAAHFGGFVSGIILGGALSLVPSIAQSGRANLLCGFLFAALVILPWWLALRRS
jgi:rhomboid protease GluP